MPDYNFSGLTRKPGLNFEGLKKAEEKKIFSPEVITPYFEIESVLTGADYLREEGDPSASRDWGDTLWPLARGFIALGYTSAEALNRGMATFSASLDALTEYYFEKSLQWEKEKKVAPPSAKAFKTDIWKEAAKIYEDNVEYWKKRAEEVGTTFIDELVGEVLGAPPGIAEFILNIPYAAAIEASEAWKKGENEIAAALIGAAKRGILGRLFHAIGPLKQWLRAPLMGSIMSAETAGAGGTPREIGKSFGTGIGFSLTSPGGQLGLNEIRRNLVKEMVKQEARIEPEIGIEIRRPEEKPAEAPKPPIVEPGKIAAEAIPFRPESGFRREPIMEKEVEKALEDREQILINFRDKEKYGVLSDKDKRYVQNVRNEIASYYESYNLNPSENYLYFEKLNKEGIRTFHGEFPKSFGKPIEGGEIIPSEAFRPEPGFRREPRIDLIKEGEPEIIKRSDLVRFLSEKLDIPIRTGRFRERALGIFKVKEEVIRTRFANDIETIAHEIGHALQKFLWPTTMRGRVTQAHPLAPFRDELMQIATKAGRATPEINEGFAEFVRLYITNEADARAKAPVFYNFFEHTLDQRSPEAKEIFQHVRERFDKYMKLPAFYRVMGQISIGEREKKNWPEKLIDFYTGTKDELYPLRAIVQEMTKGEKLPAAQDPYKLARLLKGWHGKPEAFLHHSPFEFGTYKDIGKPLDEILRPIEKLADEFRVYSVCRRSLEKLSQGIETGILRQDANEIVPKWNKDFKQIFDDAREYQDHVLRYLLDSEIISKKSYKLWNEMNRDYVPFYRVMETERVGGAGRGLEARQPIKKMKGSWRDIQDPLESIIKNTYLYLQLAEKNAIGQSLVRLAESKEGMGKYVEHIPDPMQKIKVRTMSEAIDRIRKQLEEIKDSEKAQEFSEMLQSIIEHQREVKRISDLPLDRKFMEDFGLEGIENAMEKAGLTPEDMFLISKTLDIFRLSPFVPKQNVISVWEKGERELYQVHPNVARAFQVLDRETANVFLKLFSYPSHWLRTGATLTFEFMARNPGRDQFEAYFNSKYGYKIGIDFIRGLFHALKKDDVYWEAKKAGADYATLVSMDRTYIQKNLEAVLQKYPIRKLVTNPLEGLRALSSLGEEATRLGEMAKGLKAELEAGKTKKEAAQEAAFAYRELTLDFNRVGAKTKAANMLIAFFNAQLEGTDRMIRRFREDPQTALYRALISITLPSILLTWANYDDPRYKEIPRWQKDLFWIIIPSHMTQDEWDGMSDQEKADHFKWITGTIWRFPKPPSLGLLFGTVPERIMEYIFTKDPNAFKDFGPTLVRGFSPGVIPTVGVPFVENFANKSLFFDRNIVPENREDLLPEYQYGPYTTELAKKLGKILGKLPYSEEIGIASPAKIENLVHGWTGGLGYYVMQLANAGLTITGLLEKAQEDPTKTLADIPFIKGFVVRFPTSQAESIQNFYDNYKKADRIMKTAQMLIEKEWKPEEAMQVLALGNFEKLEGTRQALTNIRATIEGVYKNPQFTADEKREFIDILYLQMIEIARQGNEIFKELNKFKIPEEEPAPRPAPRVKPGPTQIPAFQ